MRDKFYYIPLLKTLAQLLQIPCLRKELIKPNNSNEYLLCDLCIYKNHDFFKSNPHGLQVVAFYDEVETCNPLDSSAKKFKLGCVFFTLTNISPSLRSSLKSIFLAIVAKSTTIKKHIDSIPKPFINDLKKLYNEGVSVRFAGKNEVWKGALLAFLGDNLASHELGGFKESFS